MPESSAEPGQPRADSLAQLESIDVESLLDQAAALTRDAAREVGPERTESAPLADARTAGPGDARKSEARPAIAQTTSAGAFSNTTALIDRQLAQVEALVSQANVESGALAQSDMAAINDLVGQALRATRVIPPRRRPAARPSEIPAESPLRREQAGPEQAAGANAAGYADSGTSVATGDEVGDESKPDARVSNESRNSIEPAAAAADAVGADATTATIAHKSAATVVTKRASVLRRMVGLVLAPARGLLWLTNRPFDGVDDEYRVIAGWVAIITAIAAGVVWALPMILR